MHPFKLLAAALLCSATAAFAAPPKYLILDHSSAVLMDNAGAMAIWQGAVDDKMMARLVKLYPVSKWGFISQVEGGFTDDKVCVVTARVVMAPRIVGNRLVFKPNKMATTIGSQPGATREQCKELASAKLKESIAAVGSSLVTP